MDGCDYGDIPLPEGWRAVSLEGHNEMCGVMRWFYRENPDLAWYGLITDGVQPVTHGFDRLLIEEANEFGIADTDDGWRGDTRIGGAVVFGGVLLRALGWWVPEGFIHMYIDDVWEDICKVLPLRHYCEDIKVRYYHFGAGKQGFPEWKRPRDSSGARMWNGFHVTGHDKYKLAEWRKTDRAAAIERVRMAMNEVPEGVPI